MTAAASAGVGLGHCGQRWLLLALPGLKLSSAAAPSQLPSKAGGGARAGMALLLLLLGLPLNTTAAAGRGTGPPSASVDVASSRACEGIVVGLPEWECARRKGGRSWWRQEQAAEEASSPACWCWCCCCCGQRARLTAGRPPLL